MYSSWDKGGTALAGGALVVAAVFTKVGEQMRGSVFGFYKSFLVHVLYSTLPFLPVQLQQKTTFFTLPASSCAVASICRNFWTIGIDMQLLSLTLCFLVSVLAVKRPEVTVGFVAREIGSKGVFRGQYEPTLQWTQTAKAAGCDVSVCRLA